MIRDEFPYNQTDEPEGKNFAGLRKIPCRIEIILAGGYLQAL